MSVANPAREAWDGVTGPASSVAESVPDEHEGGPTLGGLVVVDELLADDAADAVGVLGSSVLQRVDDVADAVAGRLEVRDHLVGAADEQEVAGGEGVGADAAA